MTKLGIEAVTSKVPLVSITESMKIILSTLALIFPTENKYNFIGLNKGE